MVVSGQYRLKIERINMKAKDYKGIEDYMRKKKEKKDQLIKGTIICLAKGCDNYLYKNQSPCDNRYCVDCFQKGKTWEYIKKQRKKKEY